MLTRWVKTGPGGTSRAVTFGGTAYRRSALGLKVSGKGAGLDALRQGMSARFTRKAKAVPAAA